MRGKLALKVRRKKNGLISKGEIMSSLFMNLDSWDKQQRKEPDQEIEDEQRREAKWWKCLEKEDDRQARPHVLTDSLIPLTADTHGSSSLLLNTFQKKSVSSEPFLRYHKSRVTYFSTRALFSFVQNLNCHPVMEDADHMGKRQEIPKPRRKANPFGVC